MKRSFDTIVLGCGGLGSAALYWLSRELGGEVLGLEQFAHGHERGGSHDHSRIIRLSYGVTDYTHLAVHTYPCFAELEEESGVQLVFKTGGLDLSPTPAGQPGELGSFAAAMRESGIDFETWSAEDTMRHFPQFRLPGDVQVLYQKDAGLVDARKGVMVHALMARRNGAALLDQTAVQGITPHSDGVDIDTTQGRFSARRLVVTAGAWLTPVLRLVGLKLPITVTREQVSYFSSPHLRDFAVGRFPVWIYYGNQDHCFYGFPVYGEAAVKAAEDVGGQATTAETRSYDRDQRSDHSLRAFMQAHLPSALGPELYTKTCLYDMTPDRDFIVDFLPQHPNILIVSGAAHAYKFSSLLGKIAAELTLTGQTTFGIERFGLDRPGLTDPGFTPSFRLQGEALSP
ncbi:N-methyl-L-tryptophan oxidase, partial [Deinococcus frigens]|uniref:N-methyl-L-tryptophan oxidase n=1 Tax=Deinococcus frigens TaxID=249403 RepID=UPI00049843D9